MSQRLIEVAVPLPLFQTFHYELPDDATVSMGSRVSVPFRNRKLLGFVVGFPKESSSRTKTIHDVVNTSPVFSEKMLSFFQWISSHYATPIGEVIKGALPLSNAKNPRKPKPYHLKTLPAHRPKQLTEEQTQVLRELLTALKTRHYHPFLLQGVTGSGKTEVYLHLIRNALQQKKEALVLVPEIALTPQLVSRFEERFPGQIAVLHSQLTSNQRYHEWLKIKNREVTIAIGTRSSIFAPFENLGVIIVDEEHDTSFKQEERFRYNARDLSLVRGRLDDAIVVLGSATPSLESYYNSTIGKMKRLHLRHRIDQKPLPKVEIINLKENTADFGETFIFSEPLLQYIREGLDKGEQTILFLNRRGYSPFLLCQKCGFTAKCPHCSVSLTVYVRDQRLTCHYCAFMRRSLQTCDDCHSNDIKPMGLGTEKVEETLRGYFPDAKIARLDRGSTRKRESTGSILKDFSDQKIDILIGTQMVAKGHDFPNVTLVGIVLADVTLNIPDFRAPERAFQLMTQVAGRAGRGKQKGRVVIQTFNPEHYSVTFAQTHDTQGFYDTELNLRQELAYPPYSKLVHFKLADTDANRGQKKMMWFRTLCDNIRASYKTDPNVELLGPSPAPIAKIKNKYRFHLLLKSPDYKALKSFLKTLLRYEKEIFKSPTIHIDVDPMNLL